MSVIVLKASMADLPAAYLEAKIAGFEPVTDNSEVFAYEEVAIWLQTLSRICKCQPMYCCAR